MDSSNRSPPIRTESAYTIPFKEMMAIPVVPHRYPRPSNHGPLQPANRHRLPLPWALQSEKPHGPRPRGRFPDRLALHLGGFAWHTHQNPWARRDKTVFVDFIDKMLKHFSVTRKSAITRPSRAEWPLCYRVSAPASFLLQPRRLQHSSGCRGYGWPPPMVHPGQFLCLYVYQSIGRSQINRQITGKQPS